MLDNSTQERGVRIRDRSDPVHRIGEEGEEGVLQVAER